MKTRLIFFTICLFFAGTSNSVLAAATELDIADAVRFDSEYANSSAASSSAIGDLDGDGYDDLVIGDCLADTDGANSGSIYIQYGSSDVLTSEVLSDADVEITGRSADFSFGKAVAIADFNGDSYDDIAVGEPGYDFDDDGDEEGVIYIIYGSDERLTSQSIVTLDPPILIGASADALGEVLAVGNVSGSATADLLVGVPKKDAGGTNRGFVYVIEGQSGELSTTSIGVVADVAINGESDGDAVGTTIGAVNLDGDSYDDLIVGTAVSGEEVHVFYGAATISDTSTSTADAKIDEGIDPTVASSLAGGDINGDDYDDLVIGSSTYALGGHIYGGAIILYGSDTRLSGDVDIDTDASILAGQSTVSGVGTSVVVTDIDGDNYADIIVGAPGATGSAGDSAGAVFVVKGSESTFATGETALTTVADYKFEGEAEFDDLGRTFASGDMNNDTFPEFVMSATGANFGESSAGSIYLAYMYIDGDGDGLAGPDGIIAGEESSAEDNDYDNDGSQVGSDCDDEDNTVSTNQTYYRDVDGDGVGATSGSFCSSTAPSGYVATSGDCNDSNSAISSRRTYYADDDGDGAGDSGSTTLSCTTTAPSGYVSNTNDPDDTRAYEIADGIDNDADGTIDEFNTVAENGEHPLYGNKDVSSKSDYKNVVSSIEALPYGRFMATYVDGAKYRYEPFDSSSDKNTKVISWNDKGYILVVAPTGKKLALVNVYNGAVREKETLAKNGWKGRSIKTKDLRGDGSTEAIITMKKDKKVRTVIVKVKPTKDNQLKKKSSLNLDNRKKVNVKKTLPKKNKIQLRNDDKKVLVELKVNKDYQLSEIVPEESQ